MTTGAPAYAGDKNLSAAYPANWNFNLEPLNLSQILDRAVAAYADRPCIDFYGTKLTYREFGTMVDKAAKGFQDMGVKRGTRVGLYGPNTLMHPVMYFGALKAGATVVNFSPLYTEAELKAQIEDSGTTIMVTSDLPEMFANVRNLIKKGALEKAVLYHFSDMVSFTGDASAKMKFGTPVIKLLTRLKLAFNDSAVGKKITPARALMANDGNFSENNAKGDDVAVLQYTGGTTGTPKGAMLTHSNLSANAQQVQEFFAAGPGKTVTTAHLVSGQERILAAIPYFHVFGMMVTMISSLGMGSELVILPNPRDIPDLMNAIDKKKPTLFAAVPKLLQGIAQHKDVAKYDFTSLKGIFSGGAALPKGILTQFHENIRHNAPVYQGYGLTETSPVATSNPPLGDNRPETVGMPYPRTEVRICDVNDPDKVLKRGEQGEIQIRGPQVMKGYWNKPEATAEVMTTDGWFRTGDIGILDEHDYVKITDRLKRMLSINGFKVYPNVVENAISLHPAVAECVVIGVNKNTNKEYAKAIIRFKPDMPKPDEKELREFLDDKINRIEMPKEFEFTDDVMPVTAVGKPDYRKLEELEKEKQKAQQTSKPATPKP